MVEMAELRCAAAVIFGPEGVERTKKSTCTSFAAHAGAAAAILGGGEAERRRKARASRFAQAPWWRRSGNGTMGRSRFSWHGWATGVVED